MVRWLRTALVLFSIQLLLPACGQAAPAEGQPHARPLVLLVNGIVEDINLPSQVWGQFEERDRGQPGWNGMIGSLEAAGYRFGGQIRCGRSALSLPRDLNTAGVRVDPPSADLFWLQFSENAATDGIALKTMELATSIARLCEFTGREKVCLVAHSAGGLVARAYLQSAFADTLAFRHDVDRLITVATPHLGSALAEHWGDWFGTRATSLKTTASLLADLNDRLALPDDVCFASVVVRGIWTDVSGTGPDYDRLVDREFLDSLPIDFREGGDQVLSVRTQNLRLARCAGRYEASSGRAVQYLMARVRKESPEMIHTAALGDRQVQQWVQLLLEEQGGCWRGFDSPSARDRWVDRQAAACAFGMLEEQTRRDHWCGGVKGGKLRVASAERDAGPAGAPAAGHDGERLSYRFAGETTWRRHLVGMFSSQTPVAGGMLITTDAFGRVRGCEVDPQYAPAADSTDEGLAIAEF
jgi:pimeloyl-ACP methyl ester carboxylesterase